jgi:hypothetical protein
VVTISRRLGHGSVGNYRAGYAHLLPNADERAAEIMEVSFQRARNENKSGGNSQLGPKDKS